MIARESLDDWSNQYTVQIEIIIKFMCNLQYNLHCNLLLKNKKNKSEWENVAIWTLVKSM